MLSAPIHIMQSKLMRPNKLFFTTFLRYVRYNMPKNEKQNRAASKVCFTSILKKNPKHIPKVKPILSLTGISCRNRML